MNATLANDFFYAEQSVISVPTAKREQSGFEGEFSRREGETYLDRSELIRLVSPDFVRYFLDNLGLVQRLYCHYFYI